MIRPQSAMLLLAAAWTAIGCAPSDRTAGAPQPPSTTLPASQTAPRPDDSTQRTDPPVTTAPLIVRVNGVSAPKAGDTIDVEAVFERRSPSGVPLDVTVTVPRGARMVAGIATEHIEDASAPTIVRRWSFVLESLPAEDVVVAVDARGPGWGAHAEGFYRFGRPEPRLPDPQRMPPMRGRAGKQLGEPILIDPSQPR